MSRRLPLPRWAMTTAGPGDRAAAVRAHGQGALLTNWDPGAAGVTGGPLLGGPPRAWARAHGWPTPWLTFRSAFLATMLGTDEAFDLAVRESEVRVFIPTSEHTLSAADLARLDALYAERDDPGGRPTGWGTLVEALREIRRAVEAGVVVTADGATLDSWQAFYSWAHGRYHALEDGADSWIGDDS